MSYPHMCVYVCVCMLSCCQLFVTLWAVTHRFLCPQDFPGKNPGVGCHFLLQGPFLTQGLNLYLPYPLRCRQIPHHWATRAGFPGGASGKEPACQCRRHEMQVRSLGREGPLEEGMATHSSILAWSIPWTEKPGGLQSTGSQRVRQDCSDWACLHKPLGRPSHRPSIQASDAQP